MPNDIKQKIILDGEKEYSRALKEAQRNLRVLRSELKAETAELGKNATEQQKAEVKTKNLRQQIKEQEKVVKTLRDALDEVKEKYSDNADEIARWETKLNNARSTLANMRNSLNDVGVGMQSIEKNSEQTVIATNSVAESLQRIADMGGAIADGIGAGFTSIISSAREAVSAIWSEITGIAARANSMSDLAGFWNTDVMTIQKYAGAVGHVSASLEDLNSLVTKINSLDSKKVAELTGVSDVKYDDQWAYAMAVMDALSQMDTKTRNATGFELFGKGATNMFDLANDWQTVLEHLDEYDADNGGFGLDSNQMQEMSDLYDTVNGIATKWGELQRMATVKLFGDLAIDLTGNAEAIVDAFLAYFNADSDEEREAAIDTIAQNITAAFEAVAKAIEDGIKMLDKVAEDLKKSDNPTAKSLGNILGGLVDALQWIVDNQEAVMGAMGTLATFWIAGKGLQMASTIAGLAKNIALIKLFGGLGAGGAAAQAASGAAGAAGAAGGSAGSAAASGAASAGGAAAGSGLLALAKASVPNLLAAYGAHEAVKAFSSDTMTKIKSLFGANTRTDELLDEVNRQNGINTIGDMEQQILNTSKEQNQRSLAFAWNSLWNPGKEEEKAAEAVEDVVEEIEESLDDEPLLEMNEKQREAAEDYWDAMHQGSIDDQVAAYRQLEELFQDEPLVMDQLMNLIDSLTQNDDTWSMQDLPSWWFASDWQNDQITSSDLQGFRGLPASIAAAVQAGASSGVSGIRVTLDGYTVGQLIAPYVSQQIATQVGG